MESSVIECDASTIVNYHIREDRNGRKTSNVNEGDQENSSYRNKLNNYNVENIETSFVTNTDSHGPMTGRRRINNNTHRLLYKKRGDEECEKSGDDLYRITKVAEWLKNYHVFDEYPTLSNNKEVEEKAVRSWLADDTTTPLNEVRIRGFLVDIQPNIYDKPLDCVSGYCYAGCQGLTVFSEIRWCDMLPVCPLCAADGEKDLQLMFAMKLHLMDPKGNHCNVFLCKDAAECFFQCSVMEFVTDKMTRQSRLKSLEDVMLLKTLQRAHTPLNTLQRAHTPLLDLALARRQQQFFVVNTAIAPIKKPQ